MSKVLQTHAAKKKEIKAAIAAGPFSADWNSLQGYQAPAWYQDAKLGIFIHWGVYSVPGYDSEWYARNMYIKGSKAYAHHLETYGPQDSFGYKDFIPMFTAEHFDAEEWAALFRKAGAGFVVPVAEHHDGFPMYDCPYTPWNSLQMGPKRDIIGELADAVRGQYLTFGVSSHRAENWWFYNGGREIASDVSDPAYAGLYGAAQPCYGDLAYPLPYLQPNEEFLDDWLVRTCDLIDRYGPQLLYFDWWIEQPAFKPYLQRLAAYYYNKAAEWDKGVAINYKFDAFAEGSAVYDMERGQLDHIHPRLWQTCTSVAETAWCYIQDHTYKSSETLIGDLVDIVSKNGIMLLNIGPKPDGTIPEEEQRLLLEIGGWLQRNGEAVYGTRPWTIYGEGPTRIVTGTFNDTKRLPFTGRDIRYTTRGDILYATLLGRAENGRVVLTSLAEDSSLYPHQIESIELLGSSRTLTWSRSTEGVVIELPSGEETVFGHSFRLKRITS